MKAQIYVNRHKMAANKKATKETGTIVDEPAISVNTYKGSIYCKEVELTDGAKLIQNAEAARCSGATIWLEVEDFESLIIDGQRASCSMYEKEEILDLEDYFWQFVMEAAWHESKNYKAIARRLSLKYGADSVALQAMFRDLQKRLMKELDQFGLELSDDGFSDLTAHIIGMGQDEYYQVLRKSEDAIAYRNSYVESFAYVISELRV